MPHDRSTSQKPKFEGKTVDVLINGEGYIIDESSYQERDVTDWAPRGVTGSPAFSTLQLYQDLAQTSWHHGFGFTHLTDEFGYAFAGDGVDTRHPEIVTMFTDATRGTSTSITVYDMVDFLSAIYFATDSGVQRANTTGTWSTVYSTGTINGLLNNGTYLFAARDGARMIATVTGTSTNWHNAGAAGNPPNDFKRFVIHGGRQYSWQDGTNFLHYAVNTTGTDWEGSGTSDANVIVVGPGDIPIVNAISYNKDLFVFREDGAWHVAEDDNAYRVGGLDFSRERHANNFRSVAVWRGMLFFPIRHKMYRYSGGTVVDVTPPRITDTYPYIHYGDFRGLIPRGAFLYCIATTNESTPTHALLAYDGVGWHKLRDLVTHATNTVSFLGLSTLQDRLWHQQQGNTTTRGVYYTPLQSLSDLPFDDYPTSGNHYLYTAELDLGFKRIDKSFKSVVCETRNLAAGRTIGVDYRLDNGSWVSLGTLNTSPWQELEFGDAVNAQKIQFRLNFQTNSGTSAPVLETFILKAMLRPGVLYGYAFQVRLADDLESDDKLPLGKTAQTMRTDLKTARASVDPITFVTPWNETQTTYVTALTFRIQRDESGGEREGRALVNLVEIA